MRAGLVAGSPYPYTLQNSMLVSRWAACCEGQIGERDPQSIVTKQHAPPSSDWPYALPFAFGGTLLAQPWRCHLPPVVLLSLPEGEPAIVHSVGYVSNQIDQLQKWLTADCTAPMGVTHMLTTKEHNIEQTRCTPCPSKTPTLRHRLPTQI